MAGDPRNKHGVKAGQVWVDNDERVKPRRKFVVLEVDLDYYPGGRAKCRLTSRVKPGQRREFYARLSRFNGTRRGYSFEEKKPAAKKKAAAKKSTKKKPAAKKRAVKKKGAKKK